MSGQVSLTVENVFMENNIFQECVFGRWRWGWCFWKSFGICFASHDVFARQQQLPNCTLFQQVLHVNVLNMVEMVFVENVYFSGLASFCRILEWCICNMCKCMWKWMSLFSFFASAGICNKLWRTMCMYARAWFKHVARQNKRNKDNTAQRLADSLRHLTCLFVCCERKRWERGQVRICVGFWLACFASLFIGIAA